MAPFNTAFGPTDGLQDPFRRGADDLVCTECGRGFNNEAEVAKYRARQKQRDEETARAIQQAAEHARNEERARNQANENATIKQLTARLAQKDQERDEVVRQQVEAGIAAEQLRHTGTLATKDALIDRLRRENETQRRLLDDRKAKDKGTAAEIDLAAVLQKGAKHEDIKRIKSGARGADVIEPVSYKGRVVAKLYWEMKAGYTSFGKDWPAKASDDRNREGADLAVIVADHLPDGSNGGVAQLPGRIFACAPEYVPITQRFLRHHLLNMALEKARGGTGENAQAALAAFMAGEGREAIEEAKRAGDGILERGRLLEQYGKSTNDAIKELVRRQNAAYDKIYAAINETHEGDDDEN